MAEVIEREESTELVILPPKESALAVYSVAGGLDPLIEQIRDKVVGTVYDMSTAKGRAECASDAFKVAKSKTAIEKMGKALSAEYKEIPKKIDAERRRAFDELEALQKQVRQPLTEWEQAEQARVNGHRERIVWLKNFELCDEASATAIRAQIEDLEDVTIDESWEEFEAEAHRTKATTLESMRKSLEQREKYEAEQAELQKLRAEAEERRKRDEQERIAREAAERATREAEAKAKAEREAAEQREKQAAEKLERAEAERKAAELRAEQAAEAARQAEIDRQEREKAQAEAERKKREADKKHKASINNTALSAFIEHGLPEECAKQAVILIAKGVIPAVQISY